MCLSIGNNCQDSVTTCHALPSIISPYAPVNDYQPTIIYTCILYAINLMHYLPTA